MSECAAPDCEEQVKMPFQRYCSNTCMNVGVEVAAEAVDRGFLDGEVRPPKDVPDDVIEEIRRRNEYAQAKIGARITAEQLKAKYENSSE